MSYFPSILITVAGNDNNRPVRKQSCPAGLYFLFTFLGTLQPLALGGIEGGHFVRLAGRPADAGAVHGSDPEVVGVAHAQTVHRVFTNLHRGVVALDPLVAAGFTPADAISIMTSSARRSHFHVQMFIKDADACLCVKKTSKATRIHSFSSNNIKYF